MSYKHVCMSVGHRKMKETNHRKAIFAQVENAAKTIRTRYTEMKRQRIVKVARGEELIERKRGPHVLSHKTYLGQRTSK